LTSKKCGKKRYSTRKKALLNLEKSVTQPGKKRYLRVTDFSTFQSRKPSKIKAFCFQKSRAQKRNKLYKLYKLSKAGRPPWLAPASSLPSFLWYHSPPAKSEHKKTHPWEVRRTRPEAGKGMGYKKLYRYNVITFLK